jgi:hypothetical protein
MMISSPAAGDPYAAAAALDRSLRAAAAATGADAPPDDSSSDSSSDSTPVASGPDVVVTLGKSAPSPATYNASGKLDGTMSLGDLGANAPHSMAKAVEADGSDDGDGGDDGTDATSASGAGDTANTDTHASAPVDQDAAVAA